MTHRTPCLLTCATLAVATATIGGCRCIVDRMNRAELQKDVARIIAPHAPAITLGDCVLLDDDVLAPSALCLTRGNVADVAALVHAIPLQPESQSAPLRAQGRAALLHPCGCRTRKPFGGAREPLAPSGAREPFIAPSGVKVYSAPYPTGWGTFDSFVVFFHLATGAICIEVHYGWG